MCDDHIYLSLYAGAKATMDPLWQTQVCKEKTGARGRRQLESVRRCPSSVRITPNVPLLSEEKTLTHTHMRSLSAVNDSVNALLDISHLLQHLVHSGFIELQTHKLRVLKERDRKGGRHYCK